MTLQFDGVTPQDKEQLPAWRLYIDALGRRTRDKMIALRRHLNDLCVTSAP